MLNNLTATRDNVLQNPLVANYYSRELAKRRRWKSVAAPVYVPGCTALDCPMPTSTPSSEPRSTQPSSDRGDCQYAPYANLNIRLIRILGAYPQGSKGDLMSLRRMILLIAMSAVGLCMMAIATSVRAQAPALPLADGQRLAMLQKNVKYVFVLYQENRSFDSYFGTFPGAEGFYSHVPAEVTGFTQPIVNSDGTTGTIKPFRIGPAQFAADTDDIDHSHSRTVAKMHVVSGVPQMDRFAITEENKYSPTGNPSLQAKQFGELAMAYEDCDTVPFLWNYANRFVLFDHIFEHITGPSTPGNLSIISAQSGITQMLLHPDAKVTGNGDKGVGVPVVNDADPFWGSPSDSTTIGRTPVNPKDYPGYEVQTNLTFASLPLTLEGRNLSNITHADRDAEGDLPDVLADVADITKSGVEKPIPWGWYEEGYDREPTDDNDGPVDAQGRHASYIAHHNGPQYFGYIANNPTMQNHLHGLGDFFKAIDQRALPKGGGLYYVKGGYKNMLGMKPADLDPRAQKTFLGDDDHPGYSDAQISEAMLAQTINRIARSPYWAQSAIIVTWDDSEGDYDHVKPPIRSIVPGEDVVSDGPRVPLIVISPYAKEHQIDNEVGDHASVVKFVDELFGLKPLALLPDELRARQLGLHQFGPSTDLGPTDGPDSGVGDLLSAFDPERLSSKRAPIGAETVIVPEDLVRVLPQTSGYSCHQIGIVPTDIQLGITNAIPSDFNPRPRTNRSNQ